MENPQKHTRSCVSCYERKLKCNRQQPCQRCVGRDALCVYPSNKITRSRPKKSGYSSLHEKVARLEKEVIGIKDAQSNAVTVYAVDVDSLRPGEALYVVGDHGERKLLSKIGRVKIEEEDCDPLSLDRIHNAADDVDDNNPGVPFMLPMFSSMSGGPSSYAMWTPTAADFEKFLDLYCQRVDPIVRLIHKPSLRQLVDRIKLSGSSNGESGAEVATADTKSSSLPQCWNVYMPEKWSDRSSAKLPNPAHKLGEHVCSAAEYALLMAVAAAATCSLNEDDPRPLELFGETFKDLKRKVLFATEVSLSRTKLASTTDFIALQAFTLYTTTKILDQNTPEVWHSLWSPVALAIRVAITIGIHKDGSSLGLPPFQTELRRRLWWQLVLLNIRTSEDYSCELFTLNESPVKLPANLDDDDLAPDMKEWPKERSGATEMTASLLRFEAIQAVRAATASDPSVTGMPRDKANFADQIQRFQELIEIKYLAPARAQPDNIPSRLILSLGQIAVLKMCWVWGFSLMRQSGEIPQLTPEPNLSDELFITATKMLEQQILLYHEPSLQELGWIFRNIKPWDGVAILLAQMRVRLQKQYSGWHFDQLPHLLKDAWSVVTKALRARYMWHVDQNLLDGLEKMRRQLGESMGLPMETGSVAVTGNTAAPAAPVFDAESDGFFGLSNSGSNAQIDDMDLDTFMAQDNPSNMTDPWPMFIPMNFNFFGGGPL